MPRLPRPLLLALPLVGVLATTLVGCGSPSGPPDEADRPPVTRQAFGGGPVGGAFQTFANAMALIVAETDPNLEIAAEGTGGSGANLRGVDSRDLDYGISFSGDLFLGRRGMLPQDPKAYGEVRSVAALYGGVAHLVVSADSGIATVDDLPGHRIAVGNAGSGAALSATRFLGSLGLLDRIEAEYLGYSQAAEALADGKIDGFWVLSAFPNAAVTQAAASTDIRLVDLWTPAGASGFLDEYPFYSRRPLLGGVYPGVDDEVTSFQDAAWWTAHSGVAPERVEAALEAVFSDEGLRRMVQSHPAAAEMSLEAGLQGLSAPLHPGAEAFWTARGATIPDVAGD